MANSSYSNTSSIHPSLDITTSSPRTVFAIKIFSCCALELDYPSNTTLLYPDLIQTFQITHRELLLDQEGARIISERLSTIGQPPGVVESVISQIRSTAREVERIHNSGTIRIRVFLIVSHITHSEILEESMQDVPRPIPASKESIQKLEKVRFQDCSESMTECTVCYEMFHEDDDLNQIVRMPCGHVYHQDCIIKWLEISHVCPLCRYKMSCSES